MVQAHWRMGGFVDDQVSYDDAYDQTTTPHNSDKDNDGLWTEMTCETPDEHWSFGLEAFGLRVDDPTETIGERIAVGYDLEWETPDVVHGELLLGRATITVDATGTFILSG